MMKKTLTTPLLTFLGLIYGLVAHAYELAPNPNPAGNTIVVNTFDAQSHGAPFETFGKVDIQSGGRLTNFGEFTTLGTGALVTNQAGGILVNDGAEGVFVVDEVSTLSNRGLIENFGRLKNSASFFNTLTSTLNNHVGGELTNTGFFDQRGNVFNSSSFANDAGALSNTDAFLQNVGHWVNNTGSTMLNTGLTENFRTIDNSGSIINRRSLSGSISSGKFSNRSIVNNLSGGDISNQHRWFNRIGSTFNNSGVFTNGNLSLGISNEASANINNQTGGTFINQGSINNQGTITNAGTFDFQAGSNNLLKDGAYIQTAGTTIVNGTMRTLTMDIQAGVLQGAGTIDADVTIGANATLMPGNSPGTLNIIGDLNLAGLLAIEITDDTLFDIVDVTGTATLSSDLDVSFFDLWRPVAGDSFDILTADTISGTFSTLNLAALDTGLLWDVRYLLNTSGTDVVQLAVISAVPLPASSWLFISGIIGLLLKKRKTLNELKAVA